MSRRPRGRPAIEPGTPSVGLYVTFPEGTLRALTARAAADRSTVQGEIRRAVAAHLQAPAAPRARRRVVMPTPRTGF